MASPNILNKLAAALLTKANLGIAEEIAQKHMTEAMKNGNTLRVLELSEVIKLIEKAKAGAAK